MNLQALFPSTAADTPGQRIQEIMRGILYRSNFTPGVRHVIGWRGLKDCSTGIAGWTARIKDCAGIFALYFQRAEVLETWSCGRFGVAYFPDPDEDLIEKVSLAGLIYAREDNYLPHIREFLSHPRLVDLFAIGSICLAIGIDERALVLGLESLDRQCSIARDGVSLSKGNETVELIPPGGYDQDFPAQEIAEAFCRVIVHSVAFNLQEAPRDIRRIRSPGSLMVYDREGRHQEERSDEIHRLYTQIGFGDGDFSVPMVWLGEAVSNGHDVFIWRSGEPLPEDFCAESWWRTSQISDFKTLDKKGLGIDERPQFIVLTGFLGSGKTSFLHHFIEDQTQRSRFVAVIQNEIGETGLDGKLLNDDYSVTEIDEGCICCTLAGNLKKAIHQILSRFQPDTIVLETTGLANPFNLKDELVEIEDLVRFDSLTTLVDCANFRETIRAYGVARDQIRGADIVLLNKTDLVTDDELAEIRRGVRELNPRAVALAVTRGEIPPGMLYTTDPLDRSGGKALRGNGSMQERSPTTHIQDGLSTHKVRLQRPVDSKWLEDIFAHRIPAEVFRVKGIVDLTQSQTPVVVQYVGGRYELSEFRNPNVSERFLVFIGQGMDREGLERLFGEAGGNPGNESG